MKKSIISFIIIFALIITSSAVCLADEPIKVTYDGNKIEFDTEPTIVNGRVMVPMRALFEAFDAVVTWKDAIQEVSASKDGINIRFRVGDRLAEVNDDFKELYEPAFLLNGRVYICTRFIAETLGLFCDWDDATRTVAVSNSRKLKDMGKSCEIISATANNDDGNKPENVIDDNYETRWSSDMNGAELTLELKELSDIAYIGVAFYNGDTRQTRIGVAVSEDGVTYNRVIEDMLTVSSQNMEPIDLGAVYKTKFIRIYGYGNTNNAWNSITYVKAYSPQEDGTMPVDENGPGGVIKQTYQELPAEVKSVLDNVGGLFDGVIPWLANLYDKESGGFYATISAKDDPNLQPALEMTDWGVTILKTYSDGFDNMPDDVRERLINFFNERQDPETGMFIDKQGPTNERETARNQTTSLGALSVLGAQSKYVHPSKVSTGTATSSESTLPEYMKTKADFIAWIESLDWKTASWGAGDKLQSHQVYIKSLDKETQKEYLTAMFDWLAKKQHPETGLWGDTINFNSISGAFKLGLVYSAWGKTLPYPDTIIDSVVESYKTDKPTSAYYVRNPLDLLNQIANYNDELRAKVQKVVVDNIDLISNGFTLYQCPDGAFSAGYRKSMASFGGVTASHQLFESDIDGTLMILIAKNILYKIFNVEPPRLKADDFWDWITGVKELPSPYNEEMLKSFESQTGNAIDFEAFELGDSLTGTEYGGKAVAAALKTEIVRDSDRKDNKILQLKYDGTASTGPSFSFNNAIPAIKYTPAKTTAIEFDVKHCGFTGASNFYISFGNTPSYAISFGGVGTQKASSRVTSSVLNYGGTMFVVPENEWFKIKVEYTMHPDGENADIKVYVDGVLTSENHNYTNCNLGDKPVAIQEIMNVWYYKAGSGTIYLDNIKLYTK